MTEVDLLMPRPLFVAHMNIERFRPDFLPYLQENLHVFSAFEREALRIFNRGRTHYSARTIIEVLRHESALAENGGPWKLNDWWTKSLARLFVLMHPEVGEGFFEFREKRSAFEVAE